MPLRYELEIIPYLCGDIPDGVSHCSFAWERGSKLFVTEPEPVNAASRACFWKQYLRQTATMYKEGAELLPKDYAFKVQSVKPGSKAGQEKRKTIGKVHINLAQFCSESLDAQPQEVMLHLKPVGKLKVCIKATWLRNARVDADAMTEVTGASMYADSHYDDDDEEGAGGYGEGEGEEGYGRHAEEEQDLSGFDPETGEPLHRKSRRGRRGAGDAGTSGQHGGEDGEEDGEQQYDEEGNPIPRRSRRGARKGGRRHRSRHGEGIPEDGTFGGEEGEEHGGGDYGDPGGGGHGEEGEGANAAGGRRGRKGPGSAASKGEGRAKLKTYPGSSQAPTGPGGLQIEAGRQVHKAGWRDYLCCCLPRRGPAQDPLEGDSLLSKGRLDSSAPVGPSGAGGAGANGAGRR
ncbi:hypothetical protein HYH02_009859 [Chlamydomonas schloesseri]|uniref:C2 NT-type domain-containing protein n=1 Tax=Chlamydomonas schloesseri TaxID=2026947 RepID=A0A835TET4_9CHLO|nr:hypothetical protein HYH02_009859 [Chlamydomonas schloesseri]|eukprot:KAG2442068.1 hypothetical protein HYH02_009859 [Chlamydomonas schloesseri]